MVASISEVSERIARAADRSGRRPADVTLIAATKGFSAEDIAIAHEAGIRHFGENYVQESIAKQTECPPEIVWHYIGMLQTNKIRKVVRHFDWIHTLDGEDKAKRLSAWAEAPIDVLIEVNIASEPQKGGVFPENLAEIAENVYYLPKLRLRGLMTMGPLNLNPESVRPYFAKMRRLKDEMRIQGTGCLSMGMTSDYEVAIEEGATHVRIGTGIFGTRII
ncbi:MAG: YggS family pyridoxal phosphate-dependent enzyme [Armatimonadetes bacterium]|nr:YggS family pyridoxal phosphate-dependent enzyme [Armatimonadota bacterium]